jgi:hypothetical protein
MSRAEGRALVERANPTLPISQQCRLLAVPRAAVYRQSAEVGAEDLAIMALIDRQYLAPPSLWQNWDIWKIQETDAATGAVCLADVGDSGCLADVGDRQRLL